MNTPVRSFFASLSIVTATVWSAGRALSEGTVPSAGAASFSSGECTISLSSNASSPLLQPATSQRTAPCLQVNQASMVSDEGYTMMGVMRMSITHNTAEEV